MPRNMSMVSADPFPSLKRLVGSTLGVSDLYRFENAQNMLEHVVINSKTTALLEEHIILIRKKNICKHVCIKIKFKELSYAWDGKASPTNGSFFRTTNTKDGEKDNAPAWYPNKLWYIYYLHHCVMLVKISYVDCLGYCDVKMHLSLPQASLLAQAKASPSTNKAPMLWFLLTFKIPKVKTTYRTISDWWLVLQFEKCHSRFC